MIHSECRQECTQMRAYATHHWMHMYCTEICRVHFRASWILTHTCVIICHVVTSVNKSAWMMTIDGTR